MGWCGGRRGWGMCGAVEGASERHRSVWRGRVVGSGAERVSYGWGTRRVVGEGRKRGR